jgi:hypothetical protein
MQMSATLAMGLLTALVFLPSCSSKRHQTGSVNLLVRSLGAGTITSVVATVSGPAMPAPRTLPLSARGDSWGAVIGSLPVGIDYGFEVEAQDTSSSALNYVGSAVGIGLGRDDVPAVIISARQADALVPAENAAPIVDSLLLSSTNIVPNASITIEATAHDPNANDTISFAWSANPALDGFSTPSDATTNWTAPATEGDQTLILVVTDNHGASVSASIVVHVSGSIDDGKADLQVLFNDWPVVTNLVADPGNIVLGAATALVVTASDADGDALSFAWTSTCTHGSFSSTTTAATSFTLAAGVTDTSCDFIVAVSDDRGGSTTGQTTLPVGKAATIEAPAIGISAQSATVADAGSSVNFSLEAIDPQGSALTFQWVSPVGTLSNQVDGAGTSHVVWTAPATANGTFTVSAIVTDALGASKTYDFPISTSGPTPVAVPLPRFASWLLAGILGLVGAIMGGRRRRDLLTRHDGSSK